MREARSPGPSVHGVLSFGRSFRCQRRRRAASSVSDSEERTDGRTTDCLRSGPTDEGAGRGRDARRRTKIAVQRLSCTLTMSGGPRSSRSAAADGDRCDAEVGARAHSPARLSMAGALARSRPLFSFPNPDPHGGMAAPDLRVEKLRFTRTLIAGEQKKRAGRERGGPAGIISPSRKNYIRAPRQRSAFAKADIRSLAVPLPVPPPLSTGIRVIIMRMSPPLRRLLLLDTRTTRAVRPRLSVRTNMNASGGIR